MPKKSSSGIKLPGEFLRGFILVQEADSIPALPPDCRSGFLFAVDDQERFFTTERFSPGLRALASSMGRHSLGTTSDHSTRDEPWRFVSVVARKQAALAIYSAGPSGVVARVEELIVSVRDHAAAASLLPILASLQFSLVSSLVVYSTRSRRRLVLDALRLDSKNSSFLDGSGPVEGPFLFAG